MGQKIEQAPSEPSSETSTTTAHEASESWGWTRRQRIGLGILLSLLVALLVTQYLRRPVRFDGPAVRVDGRQVSLPQRVDPNTATLEELSRIPHLGDAIAQKIIDYRESRRSRAADGIVFRRLSDLDPIPGIGRKLLDQFAPFLKFPDDEVPSTQLK